ENDYRLLTLNRQTGPLLGVAPREVTGRLLSGLPLSPEWAGLIEELLSAGGTANELVRQERVLRVTHRHIVFTVLPLDPGPQGRARFCLLAEDVTERRSLDEEIAQSRKLRAVGELVGGIAHEFNNLLTPILLKAGVIQLDWPDDRRLHQEVQLISATAQRAAELTRRLLTFGRKTETHVEAVQLSAAVDSCFALLRLTVDRRIQWTNAVPSHLAPLYLNPTNLNQILVNLILNARDTLLEKLATAGSSAWVPTIHIEAAALPASAGPRLPNEPERSSPPLGWQRLTIRDNGMGMTPAVQERIYEPFYTTKEVGQGTGLGLATVWHLVHEAGGRIEVESTPGAGSTFHVLLPVNPAPRPAQADKPRVELPRSKSARVFVAEDEDMVAQTVVAALRRMGHTVHREPDGAAAWEHLQEPANHYDLFVLDVNMPGFTGIELAQRIRATKRQAAPILIISGRLSSEEMQQLTVARVTATLPKPFSIEDFQATVRRALESASPLQPVGSHS
ncbi:MAG TPA: response regulator, partial [Candidatus Didemnitutus sp.]|nr:response regulator [Candidatus Didemnitutus sp.]